MKRKVKNNNLKTVVVTITTLMFLTLLGFYLFNLYINTNISEENQGNTYTASRVIKTLEEEKKQSIKATNIIEDASASVVGISKLKENGKSIFLKDANKDLSLGTGIIVSENGYIITNWHVAGEKYSNCYVTLENGKEYQARVQWADQDLDLAIIKINAKGLKAAKLGDSDKIKIAETVYAIGNPIGFEFKRTVTSGIISAVDRTLKIQEEDNLTYMEDLIQTDASINPGNSGGPLINLNGEVIGINSVKIETAEAIGFAIPINTIKPIIQSYIQTGTFEEANIGIFAYDKNVIPYLDSNMQLENGIYVENVIENSPAEKAGIKEKDIIIKIDNIILNKMSELRKYIYTKKSEEEVILLVNRKGIISPIKIILGNK